MNHCNRLARVEVKDRYCSRANICGISTVTIARNDQHVRLVLIGWYRADNAQRSRINNADRTIQLRGDVQQTVLRAKYRIVWPDALTPIDIAHHFAGGQIDHDHVVAVRSRFAHARIAIDGHVRSSAIG